jgi:hypothetical protein
MKYVKEYFEVLSAKHPGNLNLKKTIYLASDDPDVYMEVKTK